jgi:hypothetical protein
MFPGKFVAVAFFLLAQCGSHPAVAGSSATNPGRCTAEQKREILLRCEEFIEPGGGAGFKPPKPQSDCCMSVRAVVGFDMACIAGLLTEEEKRAHDVHKILALRVLCHTELAS